MESKQKKKGFFKSKLAKSFSRPVVTKVSPSTISNTDHNMSKVNYSTVPTVSNPPTAFKQHQAVSYFKSPSFYDHKGFANEKWGRGDENVDSMAATFISTVRHRFKLDGVDN
ncbi:hypothetical protein V6N13_110246 [Hibiscus sabdariffa]